MSITNNGFIIQKAIVTGKVQGVFYRATTRQQALELGLTGYAKNLPDGSVEVMACGVEAQVQSLMDWLWQGPDRSRVDSVTMLSSDSASNSASTNTDNEFQVL
ncbi:acylphosphatase [Paraneptunicella aestuarii]|uniref:acylphosphatase n=1 Tax=Paraneptunicella aestuarii TaxID=2831148 RepID=UPI001E5002A4|nr:acylphosphatase [Paraneptunicella aestuarii]UAA37235.1 acylphosphatase [Paraneptunicella aestuarii]